MTGECDGARHRGGPRQQRARLHIAQTGMSRGLYVAGEAAMGRYVVVAE